MKRTDERLPIHERSILAVDGHHGVYAPQVFAERYESQLLATVSGAELEVLLSGPDSEFYWEVWAAVESRAKIVLNGIEYYIYQEQDIFLVPTA